METNIVKVPLSLLRPNPYQPPGRLNMTEEKARKGGESVLRSGLIQIPVGRDSKNGFFEIGDGWQRKSWYEWLVKNGHPEYDSLPIDLRELTDEQMADLIEETDENKANMNVIDRAWLWRKRLADFPRTTQTEFAKRRGISQGEIANTMRLLELPSKVQAMIISHEITESHGRALLPLKEPSLMLEFANDVHIFKWSVAELDANIKFAVEKNKPKLEETAPVTHPCSVGCVFNIDDECGHDPWPEFVDEGGIRKASACGYYEEKKTESPFKDIYCQVCRGYFTQAEYEKHKEGCPSGSLAESARQAGAEVTETTIEVKEPVKAEAKKEPVKPEKKTVAEIKREAVAKAPPAKTPATVKPAWDRQVLIQEKKDHILIGYGKVGGIPKYEQYHGSFESIFDSPSIDACDLDNPVITFMKKVEAEWAPKEGK
jgi:ParB/RepB/Spo0J family partition protein